MFNEVSYQSHWSQLGKENRSILCVSVLTVCSARLSVGVHHVLARRDNPNVRKARGLAIAVLWELGADWNSLEKIFKSEERGLKFSANASRRGVVERSFSFLIEKCLERFNQMKLKGGAE